MAFPVYRPFSDYFLSRGTKETNGQEVGIIKIVVGCFQNRRLYSEAILER